MTAAALEDQAAAPDPPASAQHLAAYLEHSAAADRELRLAIAAELGEGLPDFEQAEARAAKRLEAAYGAAQPGDGLSAGLDEEIVAERVTARQWIAEWESELAALRQRREFAQSELLPLLDARSKAKAELDAATSAKAGRELNATPELAYYAGGQKSALYGLRFGLSLGVILADRDHLEHGAAVDYWLHLCRVSGLRAEDYANELPSDAEMGRRFWDSVYANAQHPEPPPTGQQVIAAMHSEMEVAGTNKRLAQAPVRPDYRGIPEGARAVPERPWMGWDSPLRSPGGR